MENEYGDLDQVALDFSDWWLERNLHFQLEIFKIGNDINRLFLYEVKSCAKRIFGHTKLLKTIRDNPARPGRYGA